MKKETKAAIVWLAIVAVYWCFIWVVANKYSKKILAKPAQ